MTHCNSRALGLLAFLALALTTALPTTAQTVLSPTDDAYVQSNDADTPLGTTDPDRLWIRTASSLTRTTYLKFDTSSLTGSIESAILRVTVDVAPATDGVDRMDAVGAAGDEWTEATITANNAPAPGDGSSFVASVDVVNRQISTDPDTSYEFDVTELVQSDGADGTLTIVLTDLTQTAGIDIRIYSKDEASGNGPTLTVTTGDGTASEGSPVSRLLQVAAGHPNPFSARTTLDYELATAGDLTVEVFNVVGQRVATLRDGAAPAGPGTVTWDGAGHQGARLASGVYSVRFSFDGEVQTQAVTLVR